MQVRELFVLSVVAYAVVPLLLALLPHRSRLVLLYACAAAVLTLGGLLGAVYALPLGGDVTLLAGQVAYGGFVFSTVVTAVVGRDLSVVRMLVLLVVAVNLLKYAVFSISEAALRTDEAANPFGTSPEVFEYSLSTVVLGGALIVLELLLLLWLLETAKARLGAGAMVPVYPLAYVAVVVLDGVLFPLVVLRPETGLGDVVADQVRAKLVLAASFALPLLLFALLYRPTLRAFERSELRLRRVFTPGRAELQTLRGRHAAELAEERRRREESAQHERRAQATVRRMLDSATETILIALDTDLRITDVNAGARRLLGEQMEHARGRDPSFLHTVDEITAHAADLGVPATHRAVVEAQASRGGARDWEFVLGDDDRLMVSLSITPITTADGEPVGYLAVGVDITGRLQEQRALESALTHEKESLARLREADEVKRTLVSTVSHELRTPIASILGYAELLEDGDFGPLRDDQARAVSRIRRNTHRLAQVASDLLTLDRYESGKTPLDLTRIDLRDVVRAADGMDDLLAGRDVSLEVHLCDEPVPVLGDPAALQRVLTNVVGNAVKFTPDPGTVTVAVSRHGQDGVLSVTDTGIGIPEADLAHLFERFYRTEDANRRAIPGTGLGLAIVRAIVEEHVGQVEVASAVAQGTRVTVRLPLVGVPGPAPQEQDRDPSAG